MDNMVISTEPSFLEVELPQTLLESPSTSTFLPDEEASICPLLSRNGVLEPVLLSHPLSPNIITSDITSSNISNTDCKAETSSSGSSTGIAMDAIDSTTTNLFNNVNYHHLQDNSILALQDANCHRKKAKDTPGFVSWNWPLIRKCTLFVFISVILAMCSIVVATIVNMPKYCNPQTSWYGGSVFYEINPANFKDSDNNGIGDIAGIINGIDYIQNLGVSGIRLSPFVPDFTLHNTGRFVNDTALNNRNVIMELADALHKHNMKLLLDMDLEQLLAERSENEFKDLVSETLYNWIVRGVDGFYLKGLSSLTTHKAFFAKCLATWKHVIGSNRVLMADESVLKYSSNTEIPLILQHIDLIDVVLTIENDTNKMKERIEKLLAKLPIGDNKTLVHWSLGKNQTAISSRKLFAATIMQLILPGTSNLMHDNILDIAQNKFSNYSDELEQLWAGEEVNNSTDQHYINFKSSHYLNIVKRMIALREHSPSIYKSFICKSNNNKPNTQILPHRNNDIIIIVRNYPRRNSIVSVTNFGSSEYSSDLTSKFYSGTRMLGTDEKKVYFKKLQIDALDTMVVKLDK